MDHKINWCVQKEMWNLPWDVLSLSPTAPPVMHQQRRICGEGGEASGQGDGEASGQGDGQPGGHEQHLQHAPRVLD